MATGHVDDHDDLSTALAAACTLTGAGTYTATDWTIGDPGHIDEHNNMLTALGLVQAVTGAAYPLPPVRYLGDTGHIADHALLETAIMGNHGASLLTDAAWYVDAWQHNGSQTVANLGTSGSALDATTGSSGSADSNDAAWLEYVPADGDYVYLPGVASNNLTVPDSAALDVVGDLTLTAVVALDDWTPSSNQVLISKSGASGNFGYILQVNTAGTLSLIFSANGTTQVTKTSTVSTGFTDGTRHWVRATIDVDNGASGYDVKFWTSSDGSSWSQLGTTVTTATATSIYANTTPLYIGYPGTGSSNLLAGKVYRATVGTGLHTSQTIVCDVDVSAVTTGSATSFTESSSNAATVTINRNSAGRKSTLVGGWAGGGSLWLLGTDDYLNVPDHSDLDMGTGTSFTVLAMFRQWATHANNGSYIRKNSSAAAGTPGWTLRGSTSAGVQAVLSDSDEIITRAVAMPTSGTAILAALSVNRGTNLAKIDVNASTSGTTSVATLGDMSNTESMRVGRASGASTNYQDFEFVVGAVFRRTLTATELANITAYLTTRVP